MEPNDSSTPMDYDAAAHAANTRTSSHAVVAAVLAGVAWFIFPLIPALFAVYYAKKARTEIDASHGAVTGRELANFARILAWVNIGLWIALAGMIFLAVLIGVLSGT